MYGEDRQWRYFIGFGLVIILLFIIIFIIVNHGGSNKVPTTQRSLPSYSNDDKASVRLTTVGPIVAEQNHTQTQITVSNSSSTIEISRGYNGNEVASRSYTSSPAAFSEFLQALNKAGYTHGNTDESLANDAGYCPTGSRYIFTLQDGNKTVQRFWATSCGGTKTYRGNLSLTLWLFENQIPDYDTVLNSVQQS